MATLEDAETARRANQERWGALGAHAIEIQPLGDGTGYELIIHFASTPPSTIPRSVLISSAGKTAVVPVRAVTRPD